MRADYKFFAYKLCAEARFCIFTVSKKRGSVGAINLFSGFILGHAIKSHCASPPNVSGNSDRQDQK